MKNLSYEFAGRVGGGAPRISIEFKNGDVGYLAAGTCSRPVAASGGLINRADFTGDRATDCSFTVGGATVGTYAANGERSAFENYAARNPNQVLVKALLVFDEPGRYKLDRIALGTNRLYNYSVDPAVRCKNDENRC